MSIRGESVCGYQRQVNGLGGAISFSLPIIITIVILWLQSYEIIFKTLRNVPKKMRFRRVLYSFPVVPAFLNHTESHDYFLAKAAFVGYLHDFDGMSLTYKKVLSIIKTTDYTDLCLSL